MWEISNLSQAINFFYSFVFGGILCILYDILRVIRKNITHSSCAVFFEDLIYFIFSAFLIFCFLLATTNGELRFYAFFGIGLGFFIIRLSVSRVIFIVLGFVLSNLIKLFSFIEMKITSFFALLNKNFKRLIRNMKKYIKKAINTLKKTCKLS